MLVTKDDGGTLFLFIVCGMVGIFLPGLIFAMVAWPLYFHFIEDELEPWQNIVGIFVLGAVNLYVLFATAGMFIYLLK